jgi:hypothetical protein
MKFLLIVLSLLLCTTLVFAGPEKTQGATEQAPGGAKASGSPAPADTGKDAKTDSADGSQKTGSHRALVAPAARKQSAEPAEPSKPELPVWLFEIEEKGNDVTFKKKTPFGVTSYNKAKNELTEEERDLVQRYQAAKTTSGSSLDDAKRPARPAMPIPKRQER